MSTATRIAPNQRATRFNPCPICEGHGSLRRGRGERCKGYLSADGRFAFCSREEYAGTLSPNANGDYRHYLAGPCFCGQEHGAHVPVTPRPALQPSAPQPQTGPLPAAHKGATLAAEYAYRRADGTLAYRVARYEYPLQPGEAKREKTFSQFRQLDATSWAWGLGETERVLYRLPEILAAPATRTVFIVEGEKCADALAALGLVATTCPEGAKKWQNVHSRHDALRSRHVVVLPDQDKAGQEHAQQIADDLAGVAASVRVVNLPNLPAKGDVVEWIADGGDAVRLLELVIATTSQKQASDTASAQENCPATHLGIPEANTPTAAALKMTMQSLDNLRAQQATANTWTAKLNANPQIRPQYRPAVAMLHRDWRGGRPRNEHGRLPINRKVMGAILGISANAVSRQLDALHKSGVITKHMISTYDEDTGLKRDHIEIEVNDALLDRPEEIVIASNWGGMRVTCKHCGSDDLVERRTVVCKSCGTVRSSSERAVNGRAGEDGAEPWSDDAPEQNPCPATHLDAPGSEPRKHAHDIPLPEYGTGSKTGSRGQPSGDGTERPPADVLEDPPIAVHLPGRRCFRCQRPMRPHPAGGYQPCEHCQPALVAKGA